MDSLDKIDKSNSKTPFVFLFIPLAILIVVVVVLVSLYEREKPQLSIISDIAQIGIIENVEFALTDQKSGLRMVEVSMVQGAKEELIYEKKYKRIGMVFKSGPERVEETFEIKTKTLKMDDGEAELVFRVRDYSWWNWMSGNVVTLKYPVELDTRPPFINVVHSPRYIISGGSGIVTYKVNEEIMDHGVIINDNFHPGYPVHGEDEGLQAAFIGLEYDTANIDEAYVQAVDLAGNVGKGMFSMILRKARIKSDIINVSDSFLNRKLPEFMQYYPEIADEQGNVDKYLLVNNTLRKQNNEKIDEICRDSQPRRLWEGRFSRMARSSRKAGYAERRTYYHEGKKIDQQTHLGIDLASTSQAPVEAANHGVVAFAGYLGIYGNTVILDHGMGIFSLYSHLSQIKVAEGDMTDRSTVIGLTGATGMAGGDHLHFSMLVNGVFVNPLEWWDENWLKINILKNF